MKYRTLFAERTDFFRSVRIDLDQQRKTNHFIVTPLFTSLLERVISGLNLDGPRAISITGPYGSGKSETVLQLVKLLEEHHNDLIAQLQLFKPELVQSLEEIRPIVPLRINGNQGPIAPSIVNSINEWGKRSSNKAICKLAKTTDCSDLPAVVELVNKMRDSLMDRSLVLIIDELGKHLEYASDHPDQNDIYILQLLAENATRSVNPSMSLITILHQSFENYGHRLLRNQKNEFAKIQGRFEDFPFQLRQSDLLRIIGNAIQQTRINFNESLSKFVKSLAGKIYDLGVVDPDIDKNEFEAICESAAPLHPATLLLLGPLFRHFAQNERSLFGFLGSSEPFGFQQFLDDTVFDSENPRLFGIKDLFEYISNSFGPSIYHSAYSRRWAQIESALTRLNEAEETEKELVKTTGLLGLTPGHRLVSSVTFLELCVCGNLLPSIDNLKKKSILVHRRFSDSYRLWDGSDIDIDSKIEEARSILGPISPISVLEDLVPPKPITARRHSMKTGTLRWFETVYVSPDDLLNTLLSDSRPSDSDGRVYMVIGSDTDVKFNSVDLKTWQIVVWVTVPMTFWEVVNELHCIEWVRSNTPSLRDDDVARRELNERGHELEQYVESTMSTALFHQNNHLYVFLCNGRRYQTTGNRLNTIISDMCDETYPNSPVIVNEFVNRNSLSSAATAARNDVLRRMIECTGEENLGITGYPPQLPIYLSTLKNAGLHTETNGIFKLVAPSPQSTWFSAWSFLEELTSLEYQSISDIWDKLSDAPYGLRKGLLPILTVAFIQVNRNRLSLLEQGVFVPELSYSVVERLLRNPEYFSMKLTELKGTRKKLVDVMVDRGVIPESNTTSDLLALVRPLIAFAMKLPEYTRNTRSLGVTTIKVRDTLLGAKEPAELLFASLPKALGYQEILDDTDPTDIPSLVTKLVDSVMELQQSFSNLVTSVQKIVFDAFGLVDLSVDDAIDVLRKRAQVILPVVKEVDMKAMVWRMTQLYPPELWIDSLVSSIVKKPLKNWFDRHISELEVEIYVVARKFRHYETVAAAYPKTELQNVPMRLGLTTEQSDFETVLYPDSGREAEVSAIVESVMEKFKSEASKSEYLLLAAAELMRRYFIITDQSGVQTDSESDTAHLELVRR